jgi:bifunctional DNA-binding transcriptional regulator/antitoxin component of YhaV-PrlF toxin-antitoxin module
MEFRGTVELGGKTATGIEVPASVVEKLDAGKRPKVVATVGRHTYRSSVAPMGGRFMLPVSAEVREAAGIAAGDVVKVKLEVDSAPRAVEVPADLAAALKRDAKARRFFEGLSYSQQRWYTSSVEGAKKPETRQRRVDKAIEMLREGRTR